MHLHLGRGLALEVGSAAPCAYREAERYTFNVRCNRLLQMKRCAHENVLSNLRRITFSCM
jgi:hypothetical protein